MARQGADQASGTERGQGQYTPGAEPLRIEDAVNDACPWSGKPIAAESLALYRGFVVGFCNPGCRDRFEAATRHFDAEIVGYVPEDPGPDEDDAE